MPGANLARRPSPRREPIAENRYHHVVSRRIPSGGEGAVAPGGPRPATRGRLVRRVVLAVSLALAIGLAEVLVLAAIVGPNMTIAHFRLDDQRLCLDAKGGYVYARFDLVNTGRNGFAVVSFTIDAVSDHSKNYYVPRGTELYVWEPIRLSDCDLHFIGAEITNERAE